MECDHRGGVDRFLYFQLLPVGRTVVVGPVMYFFARAKSVQWSDCGRSLIVEAIGAVLVVRFLCLADAPSYCWPVV